MPETPPDAPTVVISAEAQRQVRDEMIGDALLRLAIVKAELMKVLWHEMIRFANLPKKDD